MEYLCHILNLIAIYSALAISLNLLVGQLGLLSVAQGAFYGIGAYAVAILVGTRGLPLCVGLVGALIVCFVVAAVIAGPAHKMNNDGFVIASFAFQVAIISIFLGWDSATRGPFGIGNIPSIEIFGWVFDTAQGFLLFSILVFLLAILLYFAVQSSPFGRILRCIREDERLSNAFGKKAFSAKFNCFSLAAVIAGLAGLLFAHYYSYVSPTSFTLTESVLILSMVIIGGAGSLWGPVIGAMALVVLPEILRFVGFPSSIAANMRQIIYGLALVLMMMYRPQGLVGKYRFGR